MSPSALAYTVRRAALILVAVAGFVAGMTATAAALEGQAVAGVTPQDPGGVVLSVSTTGFAWRDGIRSGQTVVSLGDTLSPHGWRLRTVDSAGTAFTSEADVWTRALIASWPIGVGSVIAGLLALVFVRTHRRWVAALAGIALYLAATPLSLQGNPSLSTLALAGVVLVPTGWFASRLGRRSLQLAVWTLVIPFTALWAWSRLAGDPSYASLEWLRGTVAGYGLAFVILATTVLPIARGERLTVVRPSLTDLVAVAVVAGLATVMVVVMDLPPVAVVLGLSLATLVLPRTRRFAARRLEHVLLADVRQHVALEAAEAERARLARELHDVPLQHLTSVIRRLEVVPDAEAETQQLREVAAQLREAATDLRPPVLDDLGLGAALEFLASNSSLDGVQVRSDVSNQDATYPATRPPSEVELAVFRIAQEAIANAIQHSHASMVRIEGDVARDGVDVTVRDNGEGIAKDGARSATRRGRLGLASMRRRAEAVDADLSIEGSSTGTRVRVRWQR